MSNQYRMFLHANGYFYHRVKVPSDIRRLYGKEIEQSSLRTRDYREALRRLPGVIVQVDNEFAQLRAAYLAGYGGTSSNASDGYHHCERQAALANVCSASEAREVTRRTWKRVAHRNSPSLESDACSSPSTAFTGDHLERIVARNEDLPLQLTNILTGEQQLQKAASCDLPLMSVIAAECFTSVVREKKWSPKTAAARHAQIRQFIDICGDKPLNRYTQENIRHLKNTLFALPPRSAGRKEFAGFSKLQIAENAERCGILGLSTETVRQVMTAANIVFGWSRTEYDHRLQNVVQPMIPRPSSGGSKRDKRHGFTSEELNRLFRSPVFTGVRSDSHWFEPGDFPMQGYGRFWVPLLALFAGARLMEAVQLIRSDVKCDCGVWFIDINNDQQDRTGKRVKNEAAVRQIPLHPTLIQLGFLEFVETIPEGSRLFPDIPIGPAVQRHRHASKMFNKLLKRAGIKGPKKVWHSLRHSFEQACRDSKVDSAKMDQLQGHSQKGMRGVYGDGYSLIALSEGIHAITYKDLDLSHIAPFHITKSPVCRT